LSTQQGDPSDRDDLCPAWWIYRLWEAITHIDHYFPILFQASFTFSHIHVWPTCRQILLVHWINFTFALPKPQKEQF